MRVILNRRPPSFGPLRRHALAHVPASRRALARGGFDLAHAFHPPTRSPRCAGACRRRWARALPPSRPFRRGGRGRCAGAGSAPSDSVAGAVVVPTRAVSAAVSTEFPAAAIELIPPGVDTALFAPGGGRAAAPTILCAADLSEPRKQVAMLARAFAAGAARRPGRAAGPGEPLPGPGLPGWAREEGIEVRPIGGDADLLAAYREAWVSALPAQEEPFGLVLAESMACGTPVLGAEHGGIPEVVADGPQGRVLPAGARRPGRRRWRMRSPRRPRTLLRRRRVSAASVSRCAAASLLTRTSTRGSSAPPRAAGRAGAGDTPAAAPLRARTGSAPAGAPKPRSCRGW